jgi:hypothetical protein
MLEEGLDVVALKKLDLPKKAAPDLKNWNTFAKSKTKTLNNYWFDWEICRNAGLLQIDFGGLYSCRSFK